MNRPTFLQGALIGAVLAVAVAAVYVLFAAWLGSVEAAKVAGSVATGGYVLFLLSRTAKRAGRFATFGLWLAGAAAAFAVSPSMGLFLAAHGVMIWLIRALFFHSSLLGVLADGGLSAVSFGALVWAASSTHSVFAAAWCFFLVQALFVAIPERLTPRVNSSIPDDDFRRAYESALRAVRRMAS